jgi:anti-sigma regulatory factor (Ser/Thr protein kinase)
LTVTVTVTVTVTATDTGPGPATPLWPPAPARPSGGGMGLWISHQLIDVTHHRHAGGYTIRMAATGHK